jgi:hypothetical protein
MARSSKSDPVHFKMRFHERVLAEWQRRVGSIKKLPKKMVERFKSPQVVSSSSILFIGLANCQQS